MSILKKLPESGCLIYGLFLLWVGILVGIPGIIWDESAVNGSGIAGLITAFVIPVMLEQFKVSFVKDYPLTAIHLYYTFAYCIAMTIYVIGGEDAELFVSSMFGIGALLISFMVDSIFYVKSQKEIAHAKKCRKAYKVGDKFSIKHHANGCHYVYYYTIVAIEDDKVVYRDQSHTTYWDNFEWFEKKIQDRGFNWEE